MIGLVWLGLFACSPEDWRMPPCEGESDATCREASIDIDGEERTYLVSRSGGYDCSDGPLDLVLVWHGSGQNGAAMRATMNDTFADVQLEQAAGGRALFVYPDGLPHRDCGRQSSCWDRDPDGRDVAFFDALLERLPQDYCVDPARTFVFGHSRGGRFTEVLACHRGAALVGAGYASAGRDNVGECPDQTPIWLAHSTGDQTIPFADGEEHRDHWAERNACATPGETPIDTCQALDCEVPVTWCPVDRAAWEGHAPPAQADAELWAFFSSL